MSIKYIRQESDLVLGEKVLCIPIWSRPNELEVGNTITLLIIYDIDSDVINIISYSHNDLNLVENIDVSKIIKTKITYFYGEFFSKDTYNIDLIHYMLYNEKIERITYNWYKFYQYKFRIKDLHRYIPITKWIEYAQDIIFTFNSQLKSFDIKQKSFIVYNNGISALKRIEKNGLKVDAQCFRESFESEPILQDYTRTHYNPFSTTGRPSNAYNNINYAALPKQGNHRDCFISRYKDGYLFEIDYSSYHVHIIADLIGYEFPTDDIHEYFGKQYFNTNHLTEEQYEASKAKTFKYLYSGDKPNNIAFYDKMDTLTNVLWEEFKTKRKVITPIGNRELHSHWFEAMNRNKLLNYIIQATETEYNYVVLDELLPYIYQDDIRLILYTYDSFLFDCKSLDKIKEVKKIISRNGKFPYRIKAGKSYGKLQSVNV